MNLNAITFLTSTVVHPVLFPYLLAPTLHAARVSMTFQDNIRRFNKHELHSWGTHISGFLIMAWGGSILCHLILCVPPLSLYSIHPWINYISVHVILTALFCTFPEALHPRIFDTLLFPLDAILRTISVTSAVDIVSSHADPRLAQSLFLWILVGATASAGGGITAATLGVWSPDWTMSTPVFLRKDASVLSTFDLWAGSLAGCTYYFLLASHPAEKPVLLHPPLLPAESASLLGAKTTIAILLTVLYAWRVVQFHWVAKKLKKE